MFAPEAISLMQPKKLVYNKHFVEQEEWPEHTAYLKCQFHDCMNMSNTSVLYDCEIIGDISTFMQIINGGHYEAPIVMKPDTGEVVESAILDSLVKHKGALKTHEFETRDTIINS